jgi:hypothetical protein
MIRFGTKSLLIVFVLVAVWLSTFSGYAAGRDVRASVLMVVFLATGYAAIYSRGRARAFWSGFFAVMLLCGGNLWQGPANKYIPNFNWRLQQPAVYGVPVYTAPQPYRPPVAATDPWAATPPPIAVAPAIVPVSSASDQQFKLAVNATIETAWMLMLATLVGITGTLIYVQIYKPAGHDAV